ncbi:MAG TPA: hypothetical protein VFF88_01020, partial [Methylocella sp.]|nr:hypothetical protein [Methylocella sp.]
MIQGARAKGIACAPWPKIATETILASAVDGAGAQGFLLVTPEGKRKRLSSVVMLKLGVLDAWAGEPESKARIERALAEARHETSMVPVSRAYLDRRVRHELARGLALGKLPPPGLLQVAETIGGAHWPPELNDWEESLASLLTFIPPAMREPEAVQGVLAGSGDWACRCGIAESWYEDNEDAARLVAGTRRQKRKARLERVLKEVIAPQRAKWAGLFAETAHWLREAPDGAEPPWREFAILAHALKNGYDL